MWTALSWQAAEGSQFQIETRFGRDRDSVAIAPWTVAVRTPPQAGSLELGGVFDSHDAFVEVRARLRSAESELRRVELGWQCDNP
jgi:hypothetical protein